MIRRMLIVSGWRKTCDNIRNLEIENCVDIEVRHINLLNVTDRIYWKYSVTLCKSLRRIFLENASVRFNLESLAFYLQRFLRASGQQISQGVYIRKTNEYSFLIAGSYKAELCPSSATLPRATLYKTQNGREGQKRLKATCKYTFFIG